MATSSKVGFISDAEMNKLSQPQNASGFVSDADMMKIESESKPSVGMSSVRQFVQGATGGFSDELAGGAEASGRVVGLHGVGGPIKNISVADEGPTLSISDLKQAYQAGRDKERESLKKDFESNPTTSVAANIAGSIASPINKLTKGMSAAKAGMTLGGVYGLGTSDADNVVDMSIDTGKGAAVGGIVGKAVDVASPYISKAANSIGGSFKNTAEKLAENATGATGIQSSKFTKGSGRILLDDGIVSFGDDAQSISKKAGESISKAESGIDKALVGLDSKSVKVDANKIVENLEIKISELQKDPSQSPVVRQLKGIIEDIRSTGENAVDVSAAEQTKRGFNKIAKNWQDPEKGQAGKIAYRAYRDAVEKTAVESDPVLAKLFTDSKKQFGTMAPIEEAATKRAAQIKQSQFANLLDIGAAGAAGATVGGPVGLITGIGAAAARRAIAPRAASSIAVTMDSASKLLLKTPELAKLAKSNPGAFQKVVEQVRLHLVDSPRAASGDSKGYEKWANNGADKIQQHDSALSKDQIEQLKKTKKGRDLLIRASDLKPKSKAMDNLFGQIKESLSEEN